MFASTILYLSLFYLASAIYSRDWQCGVTILMNNEAISDAYVAERESAREERSPVSDVHSGLRVRGAQALYH